MAAHHFRLAAALNPSSSVLRCFLALALQEAGKDEDAQRALAEVRGAEPGFGWTPSPLARTPTAPRPHPDRRPLQAQACDPDNMQARFQLASLHSARGEHVVRARLLPARRTPHPTPPHPTATSPTPRAQRALEEIGPVLDRAPREAAVHLAAARIYTQLVCGARGGGVGRGAMTGLDRPARTPTPRAAFRTRFPPTAWRWT